MSEPTAKRRKLADVGDRITDPRFANIQSDPKYRLPSKKQRIKLDKRFTQKFRNEDFTRRAKVDRYGRPIENDAEQKRLREKFDLEEEEEEESEDEVDSDAEVQRELERVEKKHDPLREGRDVSSSDSETSSDEESEEEVEEEEVGLELRKEDVPAGEVSTRIAVVNLDWDNIRAQDLMAVFSSFVPKGGRLLKVSVYPSEFGRERMEREELEGPPKEIFSTQKAQNEDSDEEMEEQDNDEDIKASMIKPDDGSEFDSQALRKYQLERLRYYYAVLAFSSKDVAKVIYDTVDGTEYLTTANSFDLRFIPDDMDFTDDKVRDECDRLPSSYQPNEFVTDALQHSKVKLTWDAEDRSRKQAITRAFKGGQREIEENDLKAYLGSDTSDDEDGVVEIEASAEKSEDIPPAQSKKDAEREKMRALLGLPAESVKKSKKKDDQPVGNIQITFSSGLSGAASDEKNRSVFANSPEPEETTAERYIRKEKERKQKRKEKMKATRTEGDDTADVEEPVETEQIGQVDTGDKTDELGFDDPFFAEGINDPRQSNKIRKEQRLKKRQEREAKEAASAKQRAELELLMAEDDAEATERAGMTGKGRTVQHFDMNDIEKAEKAKNKKQHKKSKAKRGASDRALQDDFEMKTDDPRLAKLFENHEFAIDPTNSQLRQTKAMKDLMEETRKRKQKKGAVEDMKELDLNEGQKSRVSPASKPSRGDEVKDLVAKIKRKAT